MARNYYDEWYDLMMMSPQTFKPNVTGSSADTWHKGFLWGRPDRISPISGPIPYQNFDPPIQNLGITQQPRWSPGVKHSGMPVDEPTGLFGKSNLSGLIGDNKMAAALIALRGLEAGSRGQNIFQAAAPAAMGGLSDAFIIEKYKDIRKKTKAKEKIQKSKKFTEREKLMVEAFGKLTPSKTTATMKNFAFFKNMEKTPENLMIADMVLNNQTKKDFLSKVLIAQERNEFMSKEEKVENLKHLENKWDELSNEIGAEVGIISFTMPEKFTGTQEEWNLLKTTNSTLSDERLLEEYNKLK
jgi:hypothetical protein